MSWFSKGLKKLGSNISTIVKKNTAGTGRLLSKVAAPLAVGALAIPGVGPGISAVLGSAGKALGSLAQRGVAKIGDGLSAIEQAQERSDAVFGDASQAFAVGVAQGAGADAAGAQLRRIATHPITLAGGAAVAGLLLWRLTGRRSAPPPRRRW